MPQPSLAARTVTILAAVLAPAGALAATPAQTLAAFHAALAGGDREKALELLAPQVLIYESGQVERSRDEYAAHHLTSDMAYARSVTRKVLRSAQRIDGGTAVVWEESETTGSGDTPRSLGLDTAVLEKRGDGWVIVHVHWSSRKAN